jgi:hypothetical protein
MHKTKRIPLRAETLRQLTTLELGKIAGARIASDDDACKSVDPCPGEYSWFCSP